MALGGGAEGVGVAGRDEGDNLAAPAELQAVENAGLATDATLAETRQGRQDRQVRSSEE